MKKLLINLILVVGLATSLSAQQRIAIVDTKYILNNLPDYLSAQNKVDALAKTWQSEIDQKQDEVNKKYSQYQAEKVMLSPELAQKREEQIFILQKQLRELQNKYFGFEGLLFQKKQELIKPIQDKVYSAIQKIAVRSGYDIIFDKSEGITIIFADPKFDKSEDVLREMGVR